MRCFNPAWTAIFKNRGICPTLNTAQRRFLDTLGEACVKTDGRVNADCLMASHFHRDSRREKGMATKERKGHNEEKGSDFRFQISHARYPGLDYRRPFGAF